MGIVSDLIGGDMRFIVFYLYIEVSETDYSFILKDVD